ncbi:MAG: HAD family hydrolase [Acidobacteriia bacterium]|nr:HAD family hydrolase [Terriglobia bacterium]
MASPRVIFFDVGNTLLFPNRERILEPLHQRGPKPTHEQWLQVERKTKPEFDQIVQAGAKVDHGFWWSFYTQLLESLGLSPEDSVRDALVQNTQNSGNWDRILPGTREALQRIGTEYPTAVISNADGRIEDVLRRCGIADCFHSITDSGIVGSEKPHPAIFEAALREMHAKPSESLYVGDVYSVDYLGARNAGMEAVLFDVAGAYRDRDLPRVESLRELEAWLKQ